ncbi:hypothetical protein Tco_0435817, partial [Tanacetum coccineum]
SNAYAENPVKEILLNLNLPDHRSVLTESEVHVKIEMEIPRSSRSFATLILKRSSLKSLGVQDEAIQGRLLNSFHDKRKVIFDDEKPGSS